MFKIHTNIVWNIYEAILLFQHVFWTIFDLNGFCTGLCRLLYAAGSTAGWWLWTFELMVNIGHKISNDVFYL